MLRYVCNLCKKEINAKEMSVVKTQTGEKVTVAHLHNKCLSTITGICKRGLAETHENKKETQDKKSNTLEERVKATPIEKKDNEDVKLSEEDEKSIKELAERIFGSSASKKEDTEQKTEELVELLDAKKIRLDSFNKELPSSKPRNSTLVSIQRMLLSLYRGDKMSDAANKIGVSYQSVFTYKNKYASQEIAKRHLTSKRAEKVIDSIINGFIEYGDVDRLSNELGVSVEYIKEKLAYYTGFSS